MKNNITAGLVGLIFAIGLGLSGMTDPQKVLGFLDILGSWNPSLLFVMLGAIFVHFLTYQLIIKRETPVFSQQWHIPQKSQITFSLVLGSALFGIGWGLAGYCPGPAITSLASFQFRPFIFVIGMLAGMYLFKRIDLKWKINR